MPSPITACGACIPSISWLIAVALTLTPKISEAKTFATNPLGSSVKIIDVHAHIGSFRGYDMGTVTMLNALKSSKIQLAFISNLDGADTNSTKNFDEVAANEETAKVVRQNQKLLRGLAWTRPEDGSASKIEPFLKGYLDSQGKHLFVGLKFHPEFNKFDADDPRVDKYLDLCSKYRVPAVFHCGAQGSRSAPEKIYKAARRHPTVAVVLYHTGFGTDHRDAIKIVADSLKKKNARMFLETAQVLPDAVLQAIKTVGADHVLFGTDATYFGKDHYEEYRELVETLRKELSPASFNKVMHQNAETLFRI